MAGTPLGRRLLGTRLVWKQNQKTSTVSSHQPYQATSSSSQLNCTATATTNSNLICSFTNALLMAVPPSEILRVGRLSDTVGQELCLLFTHPLEELLEDYGRSGMDVVTLGVHTPRSQTFIPVTEKHQSDQKRDEKRIPKEI